MPIHELRQREEEEEEEEGLFKADAVNAGKRVGRLSPGPFSGQRCFLAFPRKSPGGGAFPGDPGHPPALRGPPGPRVGSPAPGGAGSSAHARLHEARAQQPPRGLVSAGSARSCVFNMEQRCIDNSVSRGDCCTSSARSSVDFGDFEVGFCQFHVLLHLKRYQGVPVPALAALLRDAEGQQRRLGSDLLPCDDCALL